MRVRAAKAKAMRAFAPRSRRTAALARRQRRSKVAPLAARTERRRAARLVHDRKAAAKRWYTAEIKVDMPFRLNLSASFLREVVFACMGADGALPFPYSRVAEAEAFASTRRPALSFCMTGRL
jgi:hypothetical protein